MFAKIYENFSDFIRGISFDTLVYMVWGSYLALFIIVFLSCALSRKIRECSRRPFLCLTNAYSGVNFAVFLINYDIGQAAFVTAVFWTCGYLLYGITCALKTPQKLERAAEPVQLIQALPDRQTAVQSQSYSQVPAAKNNVRLDHAMSITEKLLLKTLGKSDRQEVERMRSTFSMLQLKGVLSPAEGEILNDNFNALLKLMAKYNV